MKKRKKVKVCISRLWSRWRATRRTNRRNTKRRGTHMPTSKSASFAAKRMPLRNCSRRAPLTSKRRQIWYESQSIIFSVGQSQRVLLRGCCTVRGVAHAYCCANGPAKDLQAPLGPWVGPCAEKQGISDVGRSLYSVCLAPLLRFAVRVLSDPLWRCIRKCRRPRIVAEEWTGHQCAERRE